MLEWLGIAAIALLIVVALTFEIFADVGEESPKWMQVVSCLSWIVMGAFVLSVVIYFLAFR